MLGEVIVDHQHVPARVLCVGGVALCVVVHEVLADSRAGHRGDVLHRCGVGRSGADDDGLVEDPVVLERLADARDRRSLLADGDVDADHVGVGLVDDGVNGNGGLSRLAVSDDELALATPDGDHGVDRQDARLHRLAHRLALHDARSLELDGATMLGDQRPLAVDCLAQGVHHAAKHGVAHGNVHDAARGAAQVALLDGANVAKEHGGHAVLVKVLGQAVDVALR